MIRDRFKALFARITNKYYKEKTPSKRRLIHKDGANENKGGNQRMSMLYCIRTDLCRSRTDRRGASMKTIKKIVLTGGDINGEPGNTDTIKVVTVTEAQTVVV